MITKKTNINFPINYGDKPNDDGSRLSDKIVRVIQNPKFQRRILSVAGAVFVRSSDLPASQDCLGSCPTTAERNEISVRPIERDGFGRAQRAARKTRLRQAIASCPQPGLSRRLRARRCHGDQLNDRFAP